MIAYPQFNPIAVQLGPIKVHWYGIMYLIGFALAWVLGRHRIKQGNAPVTLQRFEDLIFYCVIGVIFGGRLGYVLFYQPAYYFANPSHMVYVWDGGMSFHGGLLGVTIAMLLFARAEKKSFLQISDFIAPLVPLGLAMGRLGNFINGELWGRPTDLPWAMVFPTGGDVARHPSQLYEMGLEGFVLFAIVWIFSKKPRATGQVSALFIGFYGLFRFLIEFTREPDSFLGLLTFGLSMGQWLSLPMILLGIVLFIIFSKRRGQSQ